MAFLLSTPGRVGVSPVVNASAAEDCSSWTFVSSSTNRARLSSRQGGEEIGERAEPPRHTT
jgi:hypothetical protein